MNSKSKEILSALQCVLDISKTHRVDVFIVGGCLRDMLLQRPIADIDLAVSKNAMILARATADKLQVPYVLLDETYDCARMILKVDDRNVTIDFAGFRAASIEEDCQKRDFTINAMFVDLQAFMDASDVNATIQDPVGGLKDLQAKSIRVVSECSLSDDPLRVLRAFSLFAQLGFTIDNETLDLAQKHFLALNDVSMERIREELFKIFESARTYETLKLLDQKGILTFLMPQLEPMRDCVQGAYHHLDVFEHTLEAIRQYEILSDSIQNDEILDHIQQRLSTGHSRQALIKFGLLLHDVGKPDTRKKEAHKFSFHAHEQVGKKITRHTTKMLKFSTDERFIVENLVFYHLRPGYISNYETLSKRMSFRYFRDVGDNAVSVLLLSMADQRATRGPLSKPDDEERHEYFCWQLIEQFFADAKAQAKPRLMTGDDIMTMFQLKPSPLIGELKAMIDEKQALGEITDRAQAIDLIRDALKNF